MADMDDPLAMLESKTSAGETPHQETENGMSMALDALQTEELKQFAKWTATYKIGPDDPFFGSVLATKIAFGSAAAAGKAAEQVASGVEKIPDQIYNGAIKAGDEIRGQIGHEMKERTIDAGRLLVAAIDRASNQTSARIKEAAEGFEKNFDKAVSRKTESGVDLFARAAAQAAGQAARSAAASRFFWSLSGVAFLIALFALIGAGGCWEYLSLTHRITPTPIALQAGGKLDCGQAEIGGQQARVCALQD